MALFQRLLIAGNTRIPLLIQLPFVDRIRFCNAGRHMRQKNVPDLHGRRTRCYPGQPGCRPQCHTVFASARASTMPVPRIFRPAPDSYPRPQQPVYPDSAYSAPHSGLCPPPDIPRLRFCASSAFTFSDPGCFSSSDCVRTQIETTLYPVRRDPFPAGRVAFLPASVPDR